ncbi:MAG: TetR/AcrR family transcriptional regulator [Raineya sp.]|jgi:AcrR family transcriptional regulator|nr:TetR/AcrR family transcriptional regulator [Raineya sp.]
MAENREIWIKTGYEIFALQGETGLKIETLAKKVGISKSSFYHHFADLEVFMEFLLKFHLHQSQILAEKERKVKCIDPELILILVEHKTDLLFNRQLRFHQDNKAYQKVLVESNRVIGLEFIHIWMKDAQLTLTQKQLEGLYELALEKFFLQINAENLHYDWLSEFFKHLNQVAKNFE